MSIGIVLFIVVQVFNVLGLLTDLYLALNDYPTITDYAAQYPIIAYVVIGWQILGIVGLIEHFYHNE